MSRNGKLRLLAVGPGGVPTGYARVFRSLLGELHTHLQVMHYAPNCTTAPAGSPYRIVPRLRKGDIYGQEGLPEILQEFNPDVVLLCHDPGFWNVHKPALLKRRDAIGTPKCAFYCPIQWANMLPGSVQVLTEMDWLVLYTQFGHEVVETMFGDMNAAMPSLAVIPHGVDTNVFRPLVRDSRDESRRAARSALFPSRPELASAFIVLNANRNCPRKRIDLTLRAFAEFAKDKQDVWLYLHMGTTDSGCDTVKMAEELGVADRLLRTTDEARHPCISDQHLNLIYNACDVGVNTSTGEGWGLVSFEHAAAGGPQIVPNHSACAELWNGHGILVPSSERAVSVDGVVSALEELYTDQDLRRALSRQALRHAMDENFQWRTIAVQWLQLFDVV